jgi:hypothetical protein
MDELALLKGFRLVDAAPNGAREQARRVLSAAIEQRRARRRRTLALALLLAAVLAGAAYGIARELIAGDPAPEQVKQELARFGHEAELIPYPQPDDPRVEDARVAAVLESSVGPAYLFSVPSATDVCGWTWIEGQRDHRGRPDLSAVCGARDRTFWGFGHEPVGDHSLRLFSGRAGDGVARVAVRFDDRTVAVPLSGRWFFAEFSEDPDAVITYDESGDVIERHEVPGPPRRRCAPIPHQLCPSREVLQIRARGGTELIVLEVARSSDGRNCMIVRSDRTPTNRGCSIATPGSRDIGVSPMQFGGAPTGVQLLVGPVGADIARLRVRFQDGRRADVPLSEGWALYEVVPANHAESKRPSELIGLDASVR